MNDNVCHGDGCNNPITQPPSGRRRKWCSEKCRRNTCYVRFCLDCNARLSSSDGNGPNAPVRCHACASARKKVWTPDAIIAAIRRWADEHGGVPPTATDWITRGDSYHPPTSAVIQTMGWANAIRAAGYDAFETGKYGRDGEYPEVIAEAVDLYRSGLTLAQVGERQGASVHAIAYRLEKAGEPRRPRWGQAA